MLLELRDSKPAYNTPRVSPGGFLGAIWTLTTLSFLFLIARLYARWRTMRRFLWDDFFVVFAWIISLAITASCTALQNITYEIMYVGAGKKPFPPNVKVIVMEFSRLFVVVPMIFYAGIWSVKLAFLLFFQRLGVNTIRKLQWHWRIVLFMTLLCYFACYASLPYRCCLVSYEVLASPECSAQQGLSFISMKVSTTLDTFTDVLIVSIPFHILRHVRLSRRQRLALSAIFSLVVITIIFAIVRAVLTTTGITNQMDPIWLYLWTNIELNVAIIIACVAPYRSLFIPTTRHQTPPLKPKPRQVEAVTTSERVENRNDLHSTAEWTLTRPLSGSGVTSDEQSMSVTAVASSER